MESRCDSSEPGLRRWAYRRPVLVGLVVFGVLYVPLALQGGLNRDWNEVIFPLPGAVLFGTIWFALYRWGAQGRRSVALESPEDGDAVSRVLPSDADRNIAQIAQLGVLIVPALVPAVVVITSRDNPFVRAYAVQALNLQLVLAGAMGALVVTVLATNFDGAAISVVYPLCLVVYVFTLGVSLMGTIKASNGIAWRYPLNPPIFH